MNRTLAGWLLRAYPPAWRARYGEEFQDLLHAGRGGAGHGAGHPAFGRARALVA